MLNNTLFNDANANRFNQMAIKTMLSDPQMHALLNKASIMFANKPISDLAIEDQETLMMLGGFINANLASDNTNPVAGFSAINRTLSTMPVNVMEGTRAGSVLGIGNITTGAAYQIQNQLAASRSFSDGAYNPVRTRNLGMGMIGGLAAQYLRLNGTQAGDIREFSMQRTATNLDTQMEIMLESNTLDRSSNEYKELEKTRRAMKAREIVAKKLAAQMGEDADLGFSVRNEGKITEKLNELREGKNITINGKSYSASDLGVDIKNISEADSEAAARFQKGTNGTFVTKQLHKRLSDGIDDVKDVVSELEGMLHTKSFDELQNQVRDLGIGALSSKREAQKARDMLEHIERNALATGRTKEQVIKELGTIAETDAALHGGRVNTKRVQTLQTIYDTAAGQQSDSAYTPAEVTETATRSSLNAEQQMQEVMFADYAFKQLGDNATKEQKATYDSLMSQLRDIQSLPPDQRKDAMTKLLPKFKQAGMSFGGRWDDEKYRALAVQKSDIDALNTFSVGVHMMNNVNYSLETEGARHAGIMSGGKLTQSAQNAARVLAEGFGGSTDMRNAAVKELADIKKAQGADRDAKVEAFKNKYGEALGAEDVEALLRANDRLDFSSMMYINNTVDSVSQVHASTGKYQKYNEVKALNTKIAADLGSTQSANGKDLTTNMIEGFLKTGTVTLEQGAASLRTGRRGDMFSLGALDKEGKLDMDRIRNNKNLAAKLGGFDLSTEEGRTGWERYIKEHNFDTEGVSALKSTLEANGLMLTTTDKGELAYVGKKQAEEATSEMQEKLRTKGFDIGSKVFGEDNLIFGKDENGNPIITGIKYTDKNGMEATYSEDGKALDVEKTINKLAKDNPGIAEQVRKLGRENPDDKRFNKLASKEYRRELKALQKGSGKGNKEISELLKKDGDITAEEFDNVVKGEAAKFTGTDDRDAQDAALNSKFATKNEDGEWVVNVNFGKYKKGQKLGKDSVWRNLPFTGDKISDEEVEKLNKKYATEAGRIKEGLKLSDEASAAEGSAEGGNNVYGDSLQNIIKKLFMIFEEVQKLNNR